MLRGVEPTLALGCMNFGKRTAEEESQRIIARALDAGLTVLDTANVYNDGESERVVGRALRAMAPSARQRVAVHTKVGFGRVEGKPEGLSAAAIARAVDGSLERLGVERLDVYYLHVPDRATPIEESLGAMAALQQAGKIAEIGVSNYGSWEILEMIGICQRLGARPPAISQVIYNVLIRQIEIEYLRFATKYGLHTTVYNPVAGGLLAREITPGDSPPPGSRFATNALYVRRYWTERMQDAAAALRTVAVAHGHTLLELAYGWLRRRPGIGSVLLGPSTAGHLEAALAAWEKPLESELLARVDEIHLALTGTDASYAR
jgi:aryl-alcohol dehydrogenase-like predicted oxidoreductase